MCSFSGNNNLHLENCLRHRVSAKARPQCPRLLQPYQVRLIRQMHKEGFERRFLLGLFKISKSALRNILTLSSYKDIR
jgi:hypothetical protein